MTNCIAKPSSVPVPMLVNTSHRFVTEHFWNAHPERVSALRHNATSFCLWRGGGSPDDRFARAVLLSRLIFPLAMTPAEGILPARRACG